MTVLSLGFGLSGGLVYGPNLWNNKLMGLNVGRGPLWDWI